MLPWIAVAVFAVTTAAATWQLWLLPTLLLKGVRLAHAPDVSDWDTEPPPQDALAWLQERAQGLVTRGFVAGARTCVRGEIGPSVAWRAHLRHKKDRTRVALTAWHLQTDGAPRPVRQELSLQIEAARGQILVVTTSDDVEDALWPPHLTTVVLAGETDLDRVLGALAKRLAELGPDLKRARRHRHSGPEEGALRRTELLEHQRELRLVRLDEEAEEWRLTWTGACMNAFYRFWPLRRRAVARQRREARRLTSDV